jgi:membrane protease YdiL (CAAX protease family)
LAVGVGLQIGLSVTSGLFLQLFVDEDLIVQGVAEIADEAFSPLEQVLVIVGAGFLAPVAEELVFRGALLRAFLDRWGRGAAIYGTAAGFAGIHLLDVSTWLGALVVVLVLYPVGVVLARQVLRTGRLGRAIFTHIGFNLISVVALLVTG